MILNCNSENCTHHDATAPPPNDILIIEQNVYCFLVLFSYLLVLFFTNPFHSVSRHTLCNENLKKTKPNIEPATIACLLTHIFKIIMIIFTDLDLSNSNSRCVEVGAISKLNITRYKTFFDKQTIRYENLIGFHDDFITFIIE